MAIHGQWAQLLQVALLPAVGAARKVLPGAACRILWKMPLSVATMNTSASNRAAASIKPVVEPTTSAWAATAAGDSGCASTFACGYRRRSCRSSCALNSSCTTQLPCQINISAPLCSRTYSPRYLSGAQMIFSPAAARCRATSTALPEVTIQSARAFTAALVLAYTTTVCSGCSSQNAPNASAGQPRSSEQSASKSGISTRFSGFRILAVSPMKRTPQTTSVSLSDS